MTPLEIERAAELSKRIVMIDYTNHRGERAFRQIEPRAMVFMTSAWHTGEQWILFAVDIEKGASREFAMKHIHSWA